LNDLRHVSVIFQSKASKLVEMIEVDIPITRQGIYWLFGKGFVESPSWDLGEWIWDDLPNDRLATLIGYIIRKGYQINIMRGSYHHHGCGK